MSIVKFELNETQLALQLRSTLEQADSCYTKEYLPFAQANAKLSDDAFVDTLERQFAAKLCCMAGCSLELGLLPRSNKQAPTPNRL